MSKQHGLEKPGWFFAHAGRNAAGLPHCPCKHTHRTKEEAEKCATFNRLSHICEVRDHEAHMDYERDNNE